MPRKKYSNKYLIERGLKPNGSCKKTLRYKFSKISIKYFEIGDIVELVDKGPSPYGRIPNQLSFEKKYRITNKKESVIEVINNSGKYVFYYANRFKKVEQG